MLKKIFFLGFVYFSFFVFGQQKFDPQILVLPVSEKIYDKNFEKDISKLNQDIRNNNRAGELFTDGNNPENIRIYQKSLNDFVKQLDFFNTVSVGSSSFLFYRFYEHFPNVLIKLSTEKSNGSLENLKSISEKETTQYVLNFPLVKIYKEKGKNFADVKVQLYDNSKKSIVLEQIYKGGLYNPGFEFSCDGKSLNCCINNALSQALDDIIKEVAMNNATLKNNREIAYNRNVFLKDNYLNKDFNVDFLKNIIAEKDENIDLKDIYQLITNEDKTKFVGFFLKQGISQDFMSLQKNNKDKNVKILTDTDIKDPNYFKENHSNYAYIVEGVKYNGNWFYRKSNVTYFNSKNYDEAKLYFLNNLQTLNFFNENSTEFNSDFWETNLFSKVEDLKKDKDWDKYGESIWKEDELNNRDYIGLYEIVADKLRDDKTKSNESFEKDRLENFYKPYYETLLKNKSISKYSEHSLIFPIERNKSINPVLFTENKNTLTIHYFVESNGTLYEWNYIPSKTIKDKLDFGETVVNDMEKLTDWNFSVDNLNDENFWNNYVFKKSGDVYLYLKKIK